MNIPVSYKIAKLLNNNKELKSAYWYNGNKAKLPKFFHPTHGDAVDIIDIYRHKVSVENYEAPFISEVIMWIYYNRGVWINVSMENNEEDKISFYYSITEWLYRIDMLLLVANFIEERMQNYYTMK